MALKKNPLIVVCNNKVKEKVTINKPNDKIKRSMIGN